MIISKNYKIEGFSDDNGEYKAILPSGNYKLVVQAQGFDKYTRKNIKFRNLPVSLNADLVLTGISTHSNGYF